MASVAIVGAGLAGIAAALELKDAGFRITVFERDRHIGGRCASKPEPEVFDQGAQYFTVTDPNFASVAKVLERAGTVALWNASIVDFREGQCVPKSDTRRYVGVPTMRSMIETLACPLDVHTGTQIAAAHICAQGWQLIDTNGLDLGEYDAMVLAVPPEQARALVPRNSALQRDVAQVHSSPCWAMMMTLEEPLPVPFDAAFFDRLDFVWAARDSSKPGRDGVQRWVVHAGGAWSRERFSTAPDEVAQELAVAFFTTIGIQAIRPLHIAGHRWGFARVANAPRVNALWDEDLRLGVCGDWCVGPRLEGAYLGGFACPERVQMGVSRPC